MGKWLTVTTINDITGEKRVEIQQDTERSLYRFLVEQWWHAAEEDEGCLGEGFWSNTDVSGLLGSIEECEKDARASIDWLRPHPSEAI